MKITARRLRPDAKLNSFLGLLDIKLGAEIILLFGVINKVAGLYGLITVFIGGTFPQLLFYAYSTATLFAFLWALRIVKSEASSTTLLVAHLFVVDHLIQSLFHYLFFRHYWYVTPHDGKRNANSEAQQDLIDLAASRGEILQPTGRDAEGLDEIRAALAGGIWETEKVFAVWTLVFGFFLKVYFILILYSYARHLRSSTYHALPLTSRSKVTQIAHPTTLNDLHAQEEHDKLQQGASIGDAVKGNVLVGKQWSKGGGHEGEEEFSWD